MQSKTYRRRQQQHQQQRYNMFSRIGYSLISIEVPRAIYNDMYIRTIYRELQYDGDHDAHFYSFTNFEINGWSRLPCTLGLGMIFRTLTILYNAIDFIIIIIIIIVMCVSAFRDLFVFVFQRILLYCLLHYTR